MSLGHGLEVLPQGRDPVLLPVADRRALDSVPDRFDGEPIKEQLRALPEALALCLLLVDDSQRYERAIVRWHGRFCLEVRGVGAGEAQLALAALRALSGPGREAGGRALVALCQAHGLTEAGDVLERWLSQRG